MYIESIAEGSSFLGSKSVLVKVMIENNRIIEFWFRFTPGKRDAKLWSFRAYHAYNNSKASAVVMVSEMEEAQNAAVLAVYELLQNRNNSAIQAR